MAGDCWSENCSSAGAINLAAIISTLAGALFVVLAFLARNADHPVFRKLMAGAQEITVTPGDTANRTRFQSRDFRAVRTRCRRRRRRCWF